jgi:hypothetical protein
MQTEKTEGGLTRVLTCVSITGSSQYQANIFVAGRMCSIKTNSQQILEVVSAFFRNPVAVTMQGHPTASMHFLVKDHAGKTSSHFVPDDFSPHFRGFGQFVFATYGQQGWVAFNLLTREVIGIFSPALEKNKEVWIRVILPVLTGMMSAALGIVALHSACVVYQGKGVLITGDSGAGKSTLAVALAQRGLELLSDEWTYLSSNDGQTHAWGLPVPVKLLTDTTKFFPELHAVQSIRSLNGEIAFEICPEQVFNISRALHCTPMCLIFLERSKNLSCLFTPANRNEVFHHFADGLEELPKPIAHLRGPQLEILRSICQSKLFRLSYSGTPNVVAQKISDFCKLFQRETT